MMDTDNEKRMQILALISRNNPEAMRLARLYAGLDSGVSGLGDTAQPATSPGMFDTIIGALKEIAPVYTQYQLGRDIYKLNMTRAQQGLDPIDASRLSPQLQVGVTADTRNTVLVLGLVAIAALFFAFRKRR